jgi:tetratricopeptide (TPR) repeat protein
MNLKSFHRVGFLAALLFILTAVQLRAELPPEAQEAMKKGIIAAKQQDYLLAVRYFQDARKIAPDAPEIFFNLGLAESKIPSRELRAIAWFGAYLAATTNAPNAAAVKDQIDALDIKSQSNISHIIQSAQDAASKLSQPDSFWGQVAGFWAESGDFTAALKTVDLIPFSYNKIYALVGIAKVQINAGDRVGGQQTLASARKIGDLTQNTDWHYSGGQSSAYQAIAEAQAEAGDIAGAQNTAELIQEAYVKCQAQIAIAKAQTKAGDIAGANQTLGAAEKTSNLINAGMDNYKTGIAEAKIEAGDLVGAQQILRDCSKLADSLPDDSEVKADLKCRGQASVFYLQAQAGDIAGARKTLASALKTLELVMDANEKKNTEKYLKSDHCHPIGI